MPLASGDVVPWEPCGKGDVAYLAIAVGGLDSLAVRRGSLWEMYILWRRKCQGLGSRSPGMEGGEESFIKPGGHLGSRPSPLPGPKSRPGSQ